MEDIEIDRVFEDIVNTGGAILKDEAVSDGWVIEVEDKGHTMSGHGTDRATALAQVCQQGLQLMMQTMQMAAANPTVGVAFSRLNELAKTPTKAHGSDAGFDLVATEVNATPNYIEYKTGLSFAIPEGYSGFLFPRSSISKKALSLCNSVGVIDSGYRGEVTARFNRLDDGGSRYNIGDKVAQMVILPTPQVQMIEVESLGRDTDRGSGGYGSSGS